MTDTAALQYTRLISRQAPQAASLLRSGSARWIQAKNFKRRLCRHHNIILNERRLNQCRSLNWKNSTATMKDQPGAPTKISYAKESIIDTNRRDIRRVHQAEKPFIDTKRQRLLPHRYANADDTSIQPSPQASKLLQATN